LAVVRARRERAGVPRVSPAETTKASKVFPMTYQDRKDALHQSTTPRTGKIRNSLSLALAVGFVAGLGALGWAALDDVSPTADIVNDSVEDARPTGAGTVPDGSADRFQEGLGTSTSERALVAPGAPSDTDAELMEIPGAETRQVPTIGELDPTTPVDDEVLQRMAPDGVEIDTGSAADESGSD
jgi:hypothetical protein